MLSEASAGAARTSEGIAEFCRAERLFATSLCLIHLQFCSNDPVSMFSAAAWDGLTTEKPMTVFVAVNGKHLQIEIDDLMLMMLGALSRPYRGLSFRFGTDKDWYLIDDECAANAICFHDGNPRGVEIKKSPYGKSPSCR
jgi:hypothetical protein